MRSRITVFVFVSFILTVASCTPTGEGPVAEVDTTEADVEAINQLPANYAAAENAGDLDGVVAVFTDDAIRMPPNAPALIGKESIRSWMQATFDENTHQLYNPLEEVQVSGDLAFGRGTYTTTMTPKAGGEPIQDEGKYLVIFQKQPDGSWKAIRDTWNSDNPPPGR
ncbi:MAG: SgcJ/EcaC family oxidoreductase [Acidobacteriota bacterium]